MADETVEIAVSGASDDLVEVTGPCYDMGRESNSGEFCDCNIGTGVRQPPKKFALVDADRKPIAAVYALYDGAWSFALSGIMDDNGDAPLPEGMTAITRQSEETPYSTELVITAPAGTRFDEVPQ